MEDGFLRISSNEAALSVVDKFIPKTSQQYNTATNYCISPIRCDQSDVDDSDNDQLPVSTQKNTPDNLVVLSIASSSSSTSSSSSSSSVSASDSLSDTEDEQVDSPQNAIAENNSSEREKKSKKKVCKPEKWQLEVAKVRRNSGKAYQTKETSTREKFGLPWRQMPSKM